MKYYFKKFAAQKILTESDDFVWLLYFVYCSLIDVENKGGSIWDNLKQRIKEFNFDKKTVAKIKTSASFLLRNLAAYSSNAAVISPTSKIKSLQVKNFRGFGSEFNGDDKGVSIEFDVNNSIFYGPNGSGKSSLCDALEYKLTGEVREAARRSRRVSEYVKRIGSASNPSIAIKFLNPSIDGEKLTPDDKKYYSQAFIEKNRIQEFSLFGSKDTGIGKEQILSVLIGMDDLSELAKALVQSTAFKTNLTSFKRNVAENKISNLTAASASNIKLQAIYNEDISAEKIKADKLLSKSGATIADLDVEIENIKKEIENINTDTLSLSTISIISQTKNQFETLIQTLEENLQKHDELKATLDTAKTELSFLNLYTAVVDLQTTVTDSCPACDTPLASVTKNPLTKANEELVKLKGIKDQELEFANHKRIVEENLKSLELLHNNLFSNTINIASLKSLIPNGTTLNSKSPQYELSSRSVINENIIAIKKEVSTLDNYFTELESIIDKQTKKQASITTNNKKIAEFNERKNSAESIKNTWNSNQSKLDEVNLSLGTYSKDLAALTPEKDEEDKYNKFIDSLIIAYPTFYEALQLFKDLEFKTRFGKLETEIAGFYTQINKHDADHEIIEQFRINNTDSEYKIEFKTKDSALIEDASIKFSEGHLRSLGLSILLANAKINALPFIIFDDVVNAIDSDHRANIIEMMVKDSYLKDAQQIVSTHDRLYWERFSLENQKGKFGSYVLKCTKEGVVHYHYNLSFKEKIQNALNHFDIRQALLYSRIWFETIAKQYCMEHNIELKGTLKPNEFHVAIEPSLGSIYRVLNEKLANNQHLRVLHNDEINYKGINQEHHSFDEFNFNFIHSRTSHEVQSIFDAVAGLDDDIRFLKNHDSILDNLVKSYKDNIKKINTLNVKMPLDVQQGIIDRQNDILKHLTNFTSKMTELDINKVVVEAAEKIIKGILISNILLNLLKHKGVS